MTHKSQIKITGNSFKKIVKSINPKFKLRSVKSLDLGIVNPLYLLKIDSKMEYVLKICNPSFNWP